MKRLDVSLPVPHNHPHFPPLLIPSISRHNSSNPLTFFSLQNIIAPITPFNEAFLDLLKRIFVYDPKRRISAKEALNHPWFREQVRDDGTEALKLRLAREEERRRVEEESWDGRGGGESE